MPDVPDSSAAVNILVRKSSSVVLYVACVHHIVVTVGFINRVPGIHSSSAVKRFLAVRMCFKVVFRSCLYARFVLAAAKDM